jgi:hypothetical protein
MSGRLQRCSIFEVDFIVRNTHAERLIWRSQPTRRLRSALFLAWKMMFSSNRFGVH